MPVLPVSPDNGLTQHKPEILYSKGCDVLIRLNNTYEARAYGKVFNWPSSHSDTIFRFAHKNPMLVWQKNNSPFVKYCSATYQSYYIDESELSRCSIDTLIGMLKEVGLFDIEAKLTFQCGAIESDDIAEIVHNSRHSLFYSAWVLRKPFPAGEPAIASSDICSYRYADMVLHAPFPAGEEAISKSYDMSYIYATTVLKGRFRLGEPAIASNAQYSYLYALNILNAPFPAGEAAISKQCPFNHMYPRDVLKHPNYEIWAQNQNRVRGGHDPWENLR